LSRSTRFKRDDTVAGFTLIEVLVALVVVAISLAAVGSLMAATVRGTRSIEQHLALVETARAIEAALPDRGDLPSGSLVGEMSGYRWRIDVEPFATRFVDPRLATPWAPQTITITVQAPGGPLLRLDTVRLRRRIGE
jgi:general secretion pathway protein I